MSESFGIYGWVIAHNTEYNECICYVMVVFSISFQTVSDKLYMAYPDHHP